MATKSPHSHTHTRSTAFLQSPPRRNRHPRNHPVIPAKAGTQTPVTKSHQPVMATKSPHSHTHTRSTAFLQSPPRRNRHPRNHPVIPAKAGTQTPVSITPQPVIALKPPHCDPPTRPTAFLQSPPRRNRHPRNHPIIPAKAGTQTPVTKSHQPVMATKSPHSHTHTRSTAFLPSPPRRNRHPRNHLVIPAKAGTQTPVTTSLQPVMAMKIPNLHTHTRPLPHPVIPAKAGTQTPVSITHPPTPLKTYPSLPR